MKRYCFGVIINQIEGSYFSFQWRVLLAWAEKRNVQLVFLTGKALKSPEKRERMQNLTYQLVFPEYIDGLLVFSGSLGNCISRSELLEEINCWDSIPLVSINYQLGSYASVTARAEKAINEMARHLAIDHGYKKIGMVTGLPSNFDSRSREKSFAEALIGYGIELAEGAKYKGDFTPESGIEAARYFERTGLPEAIICLNDDMAHSLIETFGNLGIQVPGDVAVTGFDGFAFTKYIFPSLTTIEQPLDLITERAAEFLYGEMERRSDGDKEFSEECGILIRQSCGCIIPRKEAADYGRDLFDPGILKKSPGEILAEQCRLISDCQVGISGEELIHGRFSRGLAQLGELNNANRLDDAVDLLKDMYVLNSALSGQLQYKQTHDLFMNQWRFRNISQRISGQLYLRDLLAELLRSLPELGLDFFRLYLFPQVLDCSGGIPDSPDNIIMHLFFRDGEEPYSDEAGETVPISQILLAEESSIVKTLFFGDDIYGFIQLSTGNHYDMLYESLREVISNSLHQAYMNKRMRAAQRQLELSLAETRFLQNKFKKLSIRDEMTGLLNRRGFIEMAKEILDNSPEEDSYFLFYMDLDGLKRINDKFGHKEGDWAISSFAISLESCFRSNDLVARMGGDEFTALSRAESYNHCETIKRRLNDILDKLNKVSGKSFSLETSVGHIRFRKGDPRALDELLDQADRALYEEKNKRRGNM